MGIPAWTWFVIAAVAFVAGAAFLLRDRARSTSRNRERRRWAALRGWQFAEADHDLPRKWSGGAVAYYGDGVARDVVAGSTFTADGRRKVFVFDLEAGGRVNTVIAAVQCRRVHPVVVELWVPSTPFQREHMPELLGPVGQRYAFVSDIAGARALITPDLVDATEEIGRDIAVAWIEDGWVLAAAPPNATPSRLERLLRGVGEIADVVDPFDADADPAGEPGAGTPTPIRAEVEQAKRPEKPSRFDKPARQAKSAARAAESTPDGPGAAPDKGSAPDRSSGPDSGDTGGAAVDAEPDAKPEAGPAADKAEANPTRDAWGPDR